MSSHTIFFHPLLPSSPSSPSLLSTYLLVKSLKQTFSFLCNIVSVFGPNKKHWATANGPCIVEKRSEKDKEGEGVEEEEEIKAKLQL